MCNETFFFVINKEQYKLESLNLLGISSLVFSNKSLGLNRIRHLSPLKGLKRTSPFPYPQNQNGLESHARDKLCSLFGPVNS
jgi:hypothetical protein